MKTNTWIYIFIAFAVSYLIRVLPLTIFKKPVKNKFIRSFLFYVPYVALAVMTFPAILNATQSIWSGLVALLVGSVLALFGANLLPVAAASCLSAFIVELILIH